MEPLKRTPQRKRKIVTATWLNRVSVITGDFQPWVSTEGWYITNIDAPEFIPTGGIFPTYYNFLPYCSRRDGASCFTYLEE